MRLPPAQPTVREGRLLARKARPATCRTSALEAHPGSIRLTLPLRTARRIPREGRLTVRQAKPVTSLTSTGSRGATATVTLTATNTIASGTHLTITAEGSGATTPPTSATLSNGTASCSGTATVITALIGHRRRFRSQCRWRRSHRRAYRHEYDCQRDAADRDGVGIRRDHPANHGNPDQRYRHLQRYGECHYRA